MTMRLAFILVLLTAGASFGQMRLANPTLNQYPYGPQMYARTGYHMYPVQRVYPYPYLYGYTYLGGYNNYQQSRPVYIYQSRPFFIRKP